MCSTSGRRDIYFCIYIIELSPKWAQRTENCAQCDGDGAIQVLADHRSQVGLATCRPNFHILVYMYVESYRPGWKSGCVDDGVSTLNSEHCAARQKKFPGRAPLVERVAPVAALLPVLPLPKSVNDNVKHCVSVSLTA